MCCGQQKQTQDLCVLFAMFRLSHFSLIFEFLISSWMCVLWKEKKMIVFCKCRCSSLQLFSSHPHTLISFFQWNKKTTPHSRWDGNRTCPSEWITLKYWVTKKKIFWKKMQHCWGFSCAYIKQSFSHQFHDFNCKVCYILYWNKSCSFPSLKVLASV